MNPKKNYIDERGNYHNVENLTLTQIHDRASEEGYRLGKAEAQQKKTDGDTISRSALLAEFADRARAAKNWKENAINNGNEEIVTSADAVLTFLVEVKLTIEKAPAVEPQIPREYRQALELLDYIKERYILIEKSPTDDPSELLVGKLINKENTKKEGQADE